MSKKNIAREPLLYIHQPANRKPEAPMQHNYITPKKSSESIQPKGTVDKSIQSGRPIKRSTYYKDLDTAVESEAEEAIDEDEDEEDGETGEAMEAGDESDSKKFKDMTIEEKVLYFINTPSYAPKVRCEIKTDERTYRGLVTDFEENIVYMRVGKRSSKTKIPLDTINNVRMLGF